jgi:hypothetical protein
VTDRSMRGTAPHLGCSGPDGPAESLLSGLKLKSLASRRIMEWFLLWWGDVGGASRNFCAAGWWRKVSGRRHAIVATRCTHQLDVRL